MWLKEVDGQLQDDSRNVIDLARSTLTFNELLEVTTQDHGVILKPEVEQIAVDQEVVGDIRDPGEEGQHRGLVVLRSRSQVRIGDDDTGPFHAAKYRVALTNVKRGSVALFNLRGTS